jgi:hypothetical protein
LRPSPVILGGESYTLLQTAVTLAAPPGIRLQSYLFGDSMLAAFRRSEPVIGTRRA